MKAKLIRIGNSRGIRLPKLLIEQAGLEEDVQLELQGRTVVIGPVTSARSGWAEAASILAETDQGVLDPAVPTDFDRDEWVW